MQLKQYVEEKLSEKGSLPTYDDFRHDKVVTLLKPWGRSLIKAVEYTFPGRFKAWEFGRVPTGYWNDMENVKDAVNWLKEKVARSRYLHTKDYRDNGLHMLYQTIRKKYPDTYQKILLLKVAPKVQYAGDGASRTVRKQRVKQYVISFLEVNKRLPNRSDFVKDNMVNNLRPWKGLHVKAIAELFPNTFKPWEFGQVPDGFWHKEENVEQALLWLRVRCGRRLMCMDFAKNGLRGLYLHMRPMRTTEIADKAEMLYDRSL